MKEPLSAGPLITSFLFFVLNSPTTISPFKPDQTAYTIQPTTLTSNEPTSVEGIPLSKPKIDVDESEYVYVLVDSPSEPKGLLVGYSNLFFAILELKFVYAVSSRNSKLMIQSDGARYFAACEMGKGMETMLGDNSRILGRMWTEISGKEAEYELAKSDILKSGAGELA
jgi:hypothetical protein